MWSVWLVFCDCGFHSVCPLMEKDKRLWTLPDGRDWLWRKLGLFLMGRDMLNKSLIQFSVDGQGCVPSLLFDLRPNYGGGSKDNGDLLQKFPCVHCCTQCPQPCSRPPLTQASARHSWTSWASLGQSFTPSNHPSLNLSFYLSVCILSSCVSFRSSIAYHFNKPVIREMLASWNEAFPPFQILKEFEKDRH